MTKVFIVRPFGRKTVLAAGRPGSDTVFDFDQVEAELIKPAMEQFSTLEGGTTGEVFESGDIREDMFSSLLLADLVIADITIHNANVFYELGIRHALRDQKTILIKCPGYDETPFDILGYKYVTYDRDEPGKALPTLIRTIKDTLEDNRKDSPVFNVLPQLGSQDPEKYFALPKEFIDEAGIATAAGWPGKLYLLAMEAVDYPWKYHAYRLIGEGLYKMRSYGNAQRVWELIRDDKPDDLLSNDRLATIYQRLGEDAMKIDTGTGKGFLTRSDQAIAAIVANKTISSCHRAEAYALQARNAKMKWLNAWQGCPKEEQQLAALSSSFLEDACDYYKKGFYEDVNHYYSGINAVGMLTVIIALAERYPEEWRMTFVSEEEADLKLANHKSSLRKLQPAVQFSIESAKVRAEALGNKEDNEDYTWANVSEADLVSLTTSTPAQAAALYKRAAQLLKGLYLEAPARQLKIYEALDIKKENMQASLAALGEISVTQKCPVHTLLFTGHMIDRPGRAVPRFPNSKADEIKERIKQAILEEKARLPEGTVVEGIAGGACGGDILFHEICLDLGIASKIFLAMPRDEFIVESVAFAGPAWLDRFNVLNSKLPHPEIADKKGLPKWLKNKDGYTVWNRNNLWELYSALSNGSMNMTLLALWDGKGGDGPGGTADMVKEANSRAAKVIVFNL
jgi:hypothetical protein